MFYTWAYLDDPCLYAPYIHTPRVYMPPYAPILFYASVCFWRLCMLWGGCNGLPFVLGHPPLHHPHLGVPPLYYTPLHSVIGSQCISMFQGYQYVMWAFPFCQEGFGGVSPSVGGYQHLRCPYAHSCTFFVVHYVSHFNYGSNYYSSSYSGIFWPVFHVISDSDSFPDRVSSKLGSAWCGSTTTLDAKRLWRCSWLSFCATAATSIFNASFSLWQLCYGFSTGRFLFQS